MGTPVSYNFHVFQNILLLLFFQPFESVKKKPTLSYWTVQKQVVGWLWPTGHSCLTSGVDCLCRSTQELLAVGCLGGEEQEEEGHGLERDFFSFTIFFCYFCPFMIFKKFFKN